MDVFITGLVGFLFFQGLLLSILFLQKRPHSPNILFGMLIFRFTIRSWNVLIEQSGNSLIMGEPLFLIGPLLYLFVKLSLECRSLTRREAFLFLPLLLNGLFFLDIPEFALLILEIIETLWTLFWAALSVKEGFRRKGVAHPLFQIIPLMILLMGPASLLDRFFLYRGHSGISDFFSLFISLLEAGLIFLPSWILFFHSGAFPVSATENRKNRKNRRISQVKYEKDLLDERSLNRHYSRLSAEMRENHRYRDGEISLSGLAELMNIPPGHLSQVINRKEGINFRQYINNHRIDEACKLLSKKPEVTILEIMYDVGFSSKATFNGAFKASRGCTPGEFRKSQG